VAKLSKRMKAIAEKVDKEKQYPIEEAVALLNELSKTKLKESIDIAVNLGIDSRKSDQNIRGATTLPHGTGKSVRVAVFAQGDNAEKATAAGADLVGFEAGQVQFRTDKAGIVHGGVGQVGFDATKIRENVEALIADLRKGKPASAKGVFFKKITLSTTMGPGILIDQSSVGI